MVVFRLNVDAGLGLEDEDMAVDVRDCLSRARGGSREALGSALEACRHYLLHVAGRRLDREIRAKGGASDLVQQTFLEAQRDFAQFAGTTETELLAWLRHLLLHNVGKLERYYRTRKRHAGREVTLAGRAGSGGPEPAADLTSPSGRAAANEEVARLEEVLARLPDAYRQVIELRHREQRSFREIGARLGRTPNAARMLWVRAVERLREEVFKTHEP
jgi:RNA polymerase sigma-70 factor (ECF subfamily)